MRNDGLRCPATATRVGTWFLGALLLTSTAGCGTDGSDRATGGGGTTSGPTGGTGGDTTIPGGQPTGGTGATGGLGGGQDGGTGPTGGSGGELPLQPLAIDECGPGNAASLDDAQVVALQTPGDAAGMQFLYPYDGTVFPRGLMPPLLMWLGNDVADAVYLHITADLFEYDGCLLPDANGQVLLPAPVWEQMGDRARGKQNPYRVELTVSSGGVSHGPIGMDLIIARATMKGSIYYNSYSSETFRQAGGSNGAVLRIPPGDWAEVFLELRTCHGCHSVSADGSRLIALSSDNQGAGDGVSYVVSPDSPPSQVAVTGPGATFAGLTPDGTYYLSNANLVDVGPQQSLGPADATLYETDTGNVVSDSGIVVGALMPTFSPDGSLLTFNDYAINMAHGLAVMDFDTSTGKASGYRKVFEDATLYPAWPFLLPDNRAIVFALTQSAEFSGGGGHIAVPPLGPAAFDGPPSDLHLLDLTTGDAVLLAQAMGFATAADATAGTTYLPWGAAAETHQNYYPTVSPVASGGYFWVFFDSIRHLGNLGRQRGLWATAVTVSADGSYGSDPSHPPFYVPGQEYGAGNHRAFTALDPCQEDGSDCATGVDCCNGFCTDGKCDLPDRCAELDEVCASAADCCDAEHKCIGGYCSVVLLE